MKLLITVLALIWSSLLLCSAAWAQGSTSRTYFGTNGPQGGDRPGHMSGGGPAPDRFVVNIYGEGDAIPIEVMSQGRDECDRPFYFTGTMIFSGNGNSGSIGGPMLRCTNKELKDACLNKGITLTDYYEVGFTGTVERSPDHRRQVHFVDH